MKEPIRLIDANKLEEELNRWLDENSMLLEFDDNLVHSGERLGIEHCLLKLKESTTIDPESMRPHGKWAHRKSWDKFVCSVCIFEQNKPTNYCPNCGAKMEE